MNHGQVFRFGLKLNKLSMEALQPSLNNLIASPSNKTQEDGSRNDPCKMIPISQLLGFLNTFFPSQSRKDVFSMDHRVFSMDFIASSFPTVHHTPLAYI